MAPHICHIPKLLLECLSILNDNFSATSYMDEFRNLKTNVDRVNFVYKDLKQHNLFLPVLEDKKSDSKATELRKHGNKLFASQQYEEALKLYTDSITMAKNHKVLAVAYANRAACLYKLGMYNECRMDAERASVHNPSKQQSTFYERKKNYEPPPKIPRHQKNPLIQCASDCVAIEQNEEFGRYVVATRDIHIGEVLSVEKPYACLIEIEPLTHCHECMELCYNPIPCENCTFVLYCSEDCKEKAFKKYHWHECPVLKSLMEYGTPYSILSLRTTFLATEFYDDLDSLTFDQDEFYRSDRYKEVHCMHSGTEKRSFQDLFVKAVVCALIFEMVQTTRRFYSQPDISETFKELLMLQAQICPSNGFAIYEYSTKLDDRNSVTVGAGLYPFSSLFNHSCCPNVQRTHHGSSMVLRALNTIKRGEQCFITYGPQYDYDARDERQKKLSSVYLFDCKCEACEEDWHPDSFHMPLPVELRMRPLVYDFVYKQLLMGNVDMAKKFIPRVIAALENCEDSEPIGPAYNLKRLLYTCYCVFGSKLKL